MDLPDWVISLIVAALMMYFIVNPFEVFIDLLKARAELWRAQADEIRSNIPDEEESI